MRRAARLPAARRGNRPQQNRPPCNPQIYLRPCHKKRYIRLPPSAYSLQSRRRAEWLFLSTGALSTSPSALPDQGYPKILMQRAMRRSRAGCTVWIAARISALAVCADSSARRVQACSIMVCSGSVILDGLHGGIGAKLPVSESAQPQNAKIKRSGRDQTGRKQEHSDHGRLTECNPVRISPESQ